MLKRVHLGLVGRHQVSNALAAISVCLTLGLDSARVVETLNSLRAQARTACMFLKLKGHLEMTPTTLDSMKAGLEVLGRLGERGNRRIAVQRHLELGKASASLPVKLVA